MIHSLAVFCGSNTGNLNLYGKEAEKLADIMCQANISLVYGGAKVGMMGIIANRMLYHGANVIGVIPKALAKVEIAHDQLTQLHIVNSMHERKALMAKLADGFIMLPGGPGSLDEFFEMFTWSQLGHHAKPCAILNTAGYYDSLLNFLDHAVQQGFLKPSHRDTIIVNRDPNALISKLTNYQPAQETKWLDQSSPMTVPR